MSANAEFPSTIALEDGSTVLAPPNLDTHSRTWWVDFPNAALVLYKTVLATATAKALAQAAVDAYGEEAVPAEVSGALTSATTAYNGAVTAYEAALT